jgi:hypothetical protein
MGKVAKIVHKIAGLVIAFWLPRQVMFRPAALVTLG